MMNLRRSKNKQKLKLRISSLWFTEGVKHWAIFANRFVTLSEEICCLFEIWLFTFFLYQYTVHHFLYHHYQQLFELDQLDYNKIVQSWWKWISLQRKQLPAKEYNFLLVTIVVYDIKICKETIYRDFRMHLNHRKY